MQKIYLTNTLTNQKEEFVPFDKNEVKMYVCGPTVYDRAHIGNARSSVVFDVLYRLLKAIYPKVTYVRNITDVDDKIIAASSQSGEDAGVLTKRMTDYFHDDLGALNCLLPDHEPKATENIQQMIAMIERLIAKGHAYVSDGHVYFAVRNFTAYGRLSNRRLEEMEVGARIEVSELKYDPLDFVLWKPRKINEAVYFDSPWGHGRPGWHIECSAMSKNILGDKFDIHGGGADLIFPHHENEIAQSICESSTNQFAKYWVHNGFLTVNGDKMSKSLKNFITVKELLDLGVSGDVLRYFYLTAHYRKPLDFNQKALDDAKKGIEKFTVALESAPKEELYNSSDEFLRYLTDDLNTPLALSYIQKLAGQILKGDTSKAAELRFYCGLLGFELKTKRPEKNIPSEIILLAEERQLAKAQKQWVEADRIRTEIENLGYKIMDTKNGYNITSS
ncbi:cysteine--tRNA ligase [Candidatus Bandiella euplotis]|uniref:Cysteine--tRNA ligase n=1 Tax=Candidatus Bandiella euplotis TaxID=1664265 RepID=A0ABZ0UKG5_9RICK|nr:cysteine--tRNA ligase [Candidatus Bandiella woodruffii]WPX96625.1 Cysteine--tRNA ligase [Candidatus Bandiella woodruffii]